MKVTMQTIADRLGISKNTVSQALRNKDTVSVRTRELVHETAQKVGYNYSERANDAVTNNGSLFALITTDLTLTLNSFFGVILSEIKEKILKNNQQIDIYAISSEQEQELQLPPQIEQGNYDGIFILSYFSTEYLRKLEAIKTPKVLIDHHQPNLDIDSVLTANIDGSIEALAFLAANSVQTIGFIGDIDRSPSYQERFIGFELAQKQLNFQSKPEWTICHLKENQGFLFDAIRQLDDLPDAWFCVNNGYAYSLINYFQSHKLSIPHDVKILSFDDTDLSRMTHPRMTVMATNLLEMGDTAYALLQERITSPEAPIKQICLKPKLIKRGTV
ncbi:LacI family DNA-binding transcriptional regulator [Lapidilactobacillus achengensis]|uniref:LacI family DNA-binding transcriptional regulator n=1 Tax=Lapidilactobacillus achengensis TaxID=2486000 RepID=A0ABW1UQJ3_9LACO|nr:LacI family DNA-binding transcriptional regulator [Lapidilactobacillus achengensis]